MCARSLSRLLGWFALAGMAFLAAPAAPARDEAPPKTTSAAWTLDEARQQLRLNPRDPYLQYVALQLARTDPQRFPQVAGEVEDLQIRSGRNRRDVDLLDLFSGAAAIQESLQLDAMRGPSPDRKIDPQKLKQKVAVANLPRPDVKSHPWEEMLGDKKPQIDPLARCVPADFYYVRFRSLGKLLDVMEAREAWSGLFFRQAGQTASHSLVGRRIRTQLALPHEVPLRQLADLVIEEVAVTGSDLYTGEGSDVTLLFRYRRPALFDAEMAKFRKEAEKAHPDAQPTRGEYLGVVYEGLVTPDRALSLYTATPEAGLHLRSNSLVALQRVLAARHGKGPDGKAAPSLGGTKEFAYLRTLMPYNAAEEDGFVYLSDPFVRRLVGPELRLTERRRLLAYGRLKMVTHAALLYRTQFGVAPKSTDELEKAGFLPRIAAGGELDLPDAGGFTLAADGISGYSPKYGTPNFLTPCIEIPVADVNGNEADDYKRFLEEYKRYWTRYFDPIAVRIRVTPQQYRLETIVLPLIDNSVYTSLATNLKGKPEPLDALPVPKRNIFSMALRVDKEALVKEMNLIPPGKEEDFQRDMARELGVPEAEAKNFRPMDFLRKGLGNQVGLHVYDAEPFIGFNVTEFLGELAGAQRGRQRGSFEMLVAFVVTSLTSPVYASFPVHDAKAVDSFLEVSDRVMAVAARQEAGPGGWFRIENDFYTWQLDETTKARTSCFSFGPAKFRFHWARIGDGLYVASKPFILKDLLTAHMEQAKRDPGPAGHALVRLRLKNWDRVLEEQRLGWLENDRRASLNNLAPLSNIERALAAMRANAKAPDEAAEAQERAKLAAAVYGAEFYCPAGGKYEPARDGKVVTSSLFGTAARPRQPADPEAQGASARLLRQFNDVSAILTFEEDGLHAVLLIERK